MSTWSPLEWSLNTRFPLAGDVLQTIEPLTNWFSPQIEVNYQGDAEIEVDVVRRVASFGKQLGILADAVLELADEQGGGTETERLRHLVREIEELKASRSCSLYQRADEAVARLDECDRERLLSIWRERRSDEL